MERKEAIEVIKKNWPDSSFTMLRETLETLIPELKESEENRIKSDIQYAVRCAYGDKSEQTNKILGWIEKQVPACLSHDDEIMIRQLTEYFKTGKGLQNTNDTVVEWLTDVKRKLEKQGEQKPILPKWRYKKDNTPLSRDSLILNKYGSVAESPSGAIVSDVWVIAYDELAKLPKEESEKQGEQKPTIIVPKFRVGDEICWKGNIDNNDTIAEICDGYYLNPLGNRMDIFYTDTNFELVKHKVEPKFKVGDKIQYLTGCGTIMTIEKIENGEYIFADNMGHTTIESGNKWYLVEQKPADKVEPKFKAGDWIVFNGLTLYVNEVVQGYYRTITINGIRISYDWDIDNVARLWTIQEAKAGDVLYYKDEISLYKNDIKNCTKQETTFGGFVYHCCYDGKRFIMDSLYSLTEQDKMNIHPATKEQRDTLEKAITNAGYRWDKEKLKLEKV